jgi:hypothetical protein
MTINKIPSFLLIAGLFTVAVLIYTNSLSGDFIIDDQTGIVQNIPLHDLKGYLSQVRVRVGLFYELSRAILWHFVGAKPFYYHLFNVFTHAICSSLLFILCLVIFKDKALAFIAGLIFALHPIHTEAVSWISGGHYALSSLFFILSMIFYARSGKSLLNLLLSVIAFLFCFLTGNAVATLPLLFIVYDIFFRDRSEDNLVLRKWRLLVLLTALTISIPVVILYSFWKNPYTHLIFQYRGIHYLVVITKAFMYYLKILYLPIARGLYHPFAFNTVDINRFSPAFFSSFVVIVLLIFAFFKCLKRLKPVSFGIAWYFLAYAPYSNIIPICNIISERYLYLASAGFCIVLAALFMKVWHLIHLRKNSVKALRILALASLTLMLFSYASLTFKRNYEYNNIILYWDSNINNFPDGYFVYNNLAATFYVMGNIENAKAYCWITLLADPRQPHVWCNLGRLYRESKDLARSKDCYEQALKIDKTYFAAVKALDEIKREERAAKRKKK